jgi:uncharacterized membrane protein
LYFAVAWVWTKIFGYGEAGLRSLSALAGVVTVPVIYATCARLSSRRTALLAAALVACNPMLIWYSMEARSYALLVLFAAVASWAFIAILERPSHRLVIAWSLSSAAALWTHYYAVLVIAPQLVWLLWRPRGNQPVRYGAEAVLLAGAALSPLALSQLHGPLVGNWITATPLRTRLAQTAAGFDVGPTPPAAAWLAIGLATAAALAFWFSVRRRGLFVRSGARPVGWLLIGGIAVQFALLVMGLDQVDTRNQILLLPSLLVILACVLGEQSVGNIGIVAVTLACSCGIAVAVGIDVDPRYERPNWRPLASALGESPLVHSRAIFIENGCQILPLAIYLHGLTSVTTTDATELDVIEVNVWNDPGATNNYTVCYPDHPNPALPTRIGKFLANPAPVRVGPFSMMRYRAPAPAAVNRWVLQNAGLSGQLIKQTTSHRDLSH